MLPLYMAENYILYQDLKMARVQKIYKYNTQSETWSYITSIKDEFVDAKE